MKYINFRMDLKKDLQLLSEDRTHPEIRGMVLLKNRKPDQEGRIGKELLLYKKRQGDTGEEKNTTLVPEDLAIVCYGSETGQSLFFSVHELYAMALQDGMESVAKFIRERAVHARNTRNLILLAVRKEDRARFQGAAVRSAAWCLLVLCQAVQDGGGNLSFVPVERRRIAHRSREEREQIWEEALERTVGAAPPRVYTDLSEIGRQFLEDRNPLSEDFFLSGTFDCLFLSTTLLFDGAAALFYPGTAAALSEKLGGDFLIVFIGSMLCVCLAKKDMSRETMRLAAECMLHMQRDEKPLFDGILLYDSRKDAVCVLEEGNDEGRSYGVL